MTLWRNILIGGIGCGLLAGCGWWGPQTAAPHPPRSPATVRGVQHKSKSKHQDRNAPATALVPATILPAQVSAWEALVRTAQGDLQPVPPAYLQISPSPAWKNPGRWAVADKATVDALGLPVLWWGYQFPHKAWVWVPIIIDGHPQSPGNAVANTMMYWTDAVEYGGQTVWPPLAGGTELWSSATSHVGNPVGWTLSWVPGAPTLDTAITVWMPSTRKIGGMYGIQFLWDVQNMFNGVPMVGEIEYDPDSWPVILKQARVPNQLTPSAR